MSQSLVKTNIAKPLFATDGINSLGFKKPEAETRVVVAMSGGVDSSVVAAYLHEQGYEVIGITMQLYDHGQALAKKGACCAGQDIHDARRVSELLNIPHYVLDYESRFKEKVIDDIVDKLVNGLWDLTQNPFAVEDEDIVQVV